MLHTVPHRRKHHRPAGDFELITNGLAHRWTCDEGVGNTAANPIGGRDMALENSPSWVPGLIPRHPFSLQTNGVDQKGETPENLLPMGIGEGDFAMMLFVELLSPIPLDEAAVASAYDSLRPSICLAMRDREEWGFYFSAGWSGNPYSSTILATNTLYHLCAQRVGDTVYFYTNGVKDPQSGVRTTLIRDTKTAALGASGADTWYAHCRMNDARIYTLSLSDADIATIAAGNG